MRAKPVPAPVVRRLSLYLRQLDHLSSKGATKVSSGHLAEALSLTAAQVRRDLGFFGQFGRPGVGYSISPLADAIRRILGTDTVRKVVLVGVGGLGGALLRHGGFRRRGFEIVAAFDIDPGRIGRKVGSVVVQHVGDLPMVVDQLGVKLGIITVPASSAGEVGEILNQAGVKGILNFAPTKLPVSDGVVVESVDIASALEQLCFHAS